MILSLHAGDVGAPLSIIDSWIGESLPPHQMAAGYMTIVNQTAAADVLKGIETAAAGRVEIHRMSHEGEMMKMRLVERLGIPGDGRVELKPGGMHLMLIDLEPGLREGDEVTMTLHFENAGPRTVVVPVRKME